MAHDVVGDDREMGALAFMWCAKSVIALHEMLTYNLKWNLHVFTWLLHNLANLLVNVFTVAPQKDIWLSQLEILFWFVDLFFFFFQRSHCDLSRNFGHRNYIFLANNKMYENWRQSPETRAEKCNEAKKRSFWQTMCSFLFIPISRIFSHAQAHIHTRYYLCLPFIHFQFYGRMHNSLVLATK